MGFFVNIQATPLTWTLLLAAVFLCMAAWIRHRRIQHSLFSQLGIPYVPPHIIYGSNHELRAKGTIATEVIGSWIKKYGKVFGFYVGWQPNLVITDLDIIQQVLVKEFPTFSNRPTLVIDAQPVVDCLVGLKDQRWKDVRSLLAPTFSVIKMKYMSGIMNEKINELLENVGNKASKSETIDFHTTIQAMTLDVICECALALKTHCQRDLEGEDFFLAVRHFLKNAVNPAILMALYFKMFAKFLSFVSNQLAYSGRLTQMIIKHLKQVIAMRRKDITCRYNDVLQLMLDASHIPDATQQHSKDGINGSESSRRTKRMKALTDNEIIANAWVFLLGGFETTANTVTYTCYLLGTHPQVQQTLYQELQQVLKDTDENLTYEQIHQLKYLDQVFSETLRLYPPAVNFVSREASQDITLDGINIAKGTSIQIPLWHIHRDPQQWKQPHIFDPNRFSAESRAESTRHPMAYIPFGAGPRNCPGIRFGQLEAKLCVARLIRRYRLEACMETQIPLKLEIPTVTLNPAGPVYMKAIPRSNKTV